MAKGFGWFKKLHKEEQASGEAKRSKADTMAKRVGWFTKLHMEYQWRPRKFGSFAPTWRWKHPPLRLSAFFDDLAFRFLYILEAVVLVSAFCCFFLCCGCHI